MQLIDRTLYRSLVEGRMEDVRRSAGVFKKGAPAPRRRHLRNRNVFL